MDQCCAVVTWVCCVPGRCLWVREGEHLSGPVLSFGDIVGTKTKDWSQGG